MTWRIERGRERSGRHERREIYCGPQQQARAHFDRVERSLAPGEQATLSDPTGRIVRRVGVPRIPARGDRRPS